MGPEVARCLRTRRTEAFRDAILRSKTLLWNGPIGVFEIDPIQQGAIANAVTEATSGGAMLEHLEGKMLPGIAAVQG